MSTKTPRVSVIMPAYNVEQYIAEAIESVLNQTFTDFELIIVNDGSTDNTPKIIEKYAKQDKRIKLINQKNMGLSGARNTGLEHATADYIMFIDSDDMIKPTMCEQMYNRITKDNLDMVMCGVDLLFESEDDKGRQSGDYFNLPNKDIVPYGIQNVDSFACIVCNKIYRRKIIVGHDICFPVGLKNEDECFSRLYALWTKKAGLIKDKLYIYRIRGGSIMGQLCKTDKLGNDLFLIAKQIYHYMIKHNKYNAEVFWRFFAKSVFTSIDRTPNKKLHNTIISYAQDFVKEHYTNDVKDKGTQRVISLISKQNFWPRKKYLFGLVYVKYTSDAKYVSICGIRVVKQRLTI